MANIIFGDVFETFFNARVSQSGIGLQITDYIGYCVMSLTYYPIFQILHALVTTLYLVTI